MTISTKNLEKASEAALKATLTPPSAPTTVDEGISFATSVVRTKQDIDVGKAHFTRQLRSSLSLKEKLSII